MKEFILKNKEASDIFKYLIHLSIIHLVYNSYTYFINKIVFFELEAPEKEVI